MFGLSKLFGRNGERVRVDYGTALYVPNGTAAVKDDRPATKGICQILLSDIVLDPIPSGMTLQQYHASRSDERFWDARLLDTLSRESQRRNSADWLHKALGHERLVFFLGTTFVTSGDEEVAPFLNLSGALPALRYVYRVAQKVGSGPGSGDPLLAALGIHPPTAYAALLPRTH